MLGVLLWGCTGSPADGEGTRSAAQHTVLDDSEPTQPTIQHTVPAKIARLPDYAILDLGDDPRQLTDVDLNDGSGTQELGASKLLREFGVIEMLNSYVINIPSTAVSIAGWEVNKAQVSNFYYFADADADGEILDHFESSVLRFADHAMTSLPEADPMLHDAFFEVLEACGRASDWPDVELFVLHQGRSGDIMSHLIEPTFGLTYFEYQQLRHQCARYAATYPTMDPVVRDKRLKPQREHFAEVILDRLDNELPLVEVPPEYQDEIDGLRANGW
ncbi:hypothetical protein [Candidatus Poriferisodalis sp.]|uniref:hypothetical protein n=1 Tax=Candidatus Poriferisodalis sp. TaxID=3101277 RepID=UPI003B011292